MHVRPGAGAHPRDRHEARFDSHCSTALMLVHVELVPVLLRDVSLQLALICKHHKLRFAAPLERARVVFTPKVLLQLLVLVEVIVLLGVVPPAEVAVVVALLHVLVDLLRVIQVQAAEPALGAIVKNKGHQPATAYVIARSQPTSTFEGTTTVAVGLPNAQAYRR
jgi:hypothetical protein